MWSYKRGIKRPFRLHMIWRAVEMYKRRGLYYVGEIVVHDGEYHYEYRFIKGDEL